MDNTIEADKVIVVLAKVAAPGKAQRPRVENSDAYGKAHTKLPCLQRDLPPVPRSTKGYVTLIVHGPINCRQNSLTNIGQLLVQQQPVVCLNSVKPGPLYGACQCHAASVPGDPSLPLTHVPSTKNRSMVEI